MPIKPISAERLLEIQAEGWAAAKPPEVANADAFLALYEPTELPFRGKVYTVPPIPATSGVRLFALRRELERVRDNPPETQEEFLAFEGLYARILDLCWTLLEPRPAMNPFAKASPAEVGGLLNFFSRCLMRSSVPGQSTTGRPGPSIS